MFKFGKCHAHLELHRIKMKKEDKRPLTLPRMAQLKLTQHLIIDTNNVKAGILLCMNTGIRINLKVNSFWIKIDAFIVARSLGNYCYA